MGYVHVDKTVTKAEQILFAIKSLSKHLSMRELIRITTAHVFSILLHEIEVWFACSSFRDRSRIDAVFYNLLCRMLKRRHYTHQADLLALSG